VEEDDVDEGSDDGEVEDVDGDGSDVVVAP